MSKWTNFRDDLETKLKAFFGNAAEVAEPIAEHALETTGAAIAQAALSGTLHNSHDMIAVATASLKQQAPMLTASVTTAAASLLVHQAAQAAAQTADSPLNQPPV
jgi:hypothetical protein